MKSKKDKETIPQVEMLNELKSINNSIKRIDFGPVKKNATHGLEFFIKIGIFVTSILLIIYGVADTYNWNEYITVGLFMLVAAIMIAIGGDN